MYTLFTDALNDHAGVFHNQLCTADQKHHTCSGLVASVRILHNVKQVRTPAVSTLYNCFIKHFSSFVVNSTEDQNSRTLFMSVFYRFLNGCFTDIVDEFHPQITHRTIMNFKKCIRLL